MFTHACIDHVPFSLCPNSEPPRTRNHKGGVGVWDCGHIPSAITWYIEVVPAGNAATLLPVIQAHVAPGTIMHSDEWAAYNQVWNLPNVGSYQTVN